MYGPGWGWRRRGWGWRRPMFGFGFPGCGCLFFVLFIALGLCWAISGGFFHPFYYFYR